jgi:hypothetical protein
MRGFLNKKTNKVDNPVKEERGLEKISVWAGSSDDASTRTQAKMVRKESDLSLQREITILTRLFPSISRHSCRRTSRQQSISVGTKTREI